MRARWRVWAASIAGLTLLSAVVATQNYLAFEAQRDLRPGALAPAISWARLFALENVAAGGAQVTIELPAVRPGREASAAPAGPLAAAVVASAPPIT